MAKGRAQLIDVPELKRQMRSAVRKSLEEQVPLNSVIRDVEELVQSLYDKTLMHWDGGEGVKAFSNHSSKTHTERDTPKVKIQVTKNADKTGAVLTAHVESYIWNLLDQGRAERVTEKVEKFVGRDRNKPRTIPGTLDVSDQRYYTEVVYVPKGTTIEGIKARGWTDLVIEKAEQELADKYPHIRFTFSTKE